MTSDYEFGPDALGYRAKIALLVPATNTIAQPECEALRPPGVTNHVARMAPSTRGALRSGDLVGYRASLARSSEHIKQAIDQVLPCRPDAIVLGHSIDTFRGGVDGAQQLQRELEEHAGGTRVILPALSFLRALQALGIKRRIAALTPYWPPGDEQVEEFFRSAGYTITRIIGLKCEGPLAIASTPAVQIQHALAELAHERPEAIVQPGTNLATLTLAAQGGRTFGAPVLPCNGVTYWDALRQLSIADRRTDLDDLWAMH